jgi:hypothetical protein
VASQQEFGRALAALRDVVGAGELSSLIAAGAKTKRLRKRLRLSKYCV